MSLDIIDTKAMNAPPVRCLNALTAALFAPEHILQLLAEWNQSAEAEAKGRGSDFEPVTISQLLDVAQQWLADLEASNPQYPFARVVHSLFQSTAEAVKAEDATQQIAAANDFMRQHPGLGGEWMLTEAVLSLPEYERQQLIQKVIDFDDFSAENDPWREHDFGRLEQNGEVYFYKIDYYEKEPQPDAAERFLYAENLSQIKRVLTLLHASEY